MSQLAEEDALAASHRATLARREVASLHDQLEQMTQAYAKEKLNFAATVNKLTQVRPVLCCCLALVPIQFLTFPLADFLSSRSYT